MKKEDNRGEKDKIKIKIILFNTKLDFLINKE